MKPGRIYRSRGELDGSSLNRSPHSYLNNPEAERDRYAEETLPVRSNVRPVLHHMSFSDAFRYKWNTDKQVLVLKFTDLDGDGIGMLR